MDKFKVGVLGADTPVGMQLINILSKHPVAELTAISSDINNGRPIDEVRPQMLGICDRIMVSEQEVMAKSDVVFNAGRTKDSHELAAQSIKSKCVFIDLGRSFRLDNAELHKEWYGTEYLYPELHDAAVYGLPELLRDQLTGKVIAACPGAVATAASLALAPAIFGGLASHENIIIDAKCSPVCDFGRSLGDIPFGELGGGILGNTLAAHIETPEIERILTLAAEKTVRLVLRSNTIPIPRGVMVTCYAKGLSVTSEKTLRNIYEKMYSGERFITLLPSGVIPSLRYVIGTNRCAISLAYDDRTATAVITAVLDDLMKGSAGQAVQNMNAMLSMPEHIGLE